MDPAAGKIKAHAMMPCRQGIMKKKTNTPSGM